MSRRATGLVPHVSGVSFGVFSRASFVIQPRPRLRTLLDGAGPQRSGPRGAPDFEIEVGQWMCGPRRRSDEGCVEPDTALGVQPKQKKNLSCGISSVSVADFCCRRITVIPWI